MKLLSWLFPASASAKAPADPREQRRQLAERVMTPERQALIARAMEVRQSKQQLLKELEAAGGPERLAEALRRMMNEK